MKVLDNKLACSVSLELGLCISLMNPYEGIEAARGYGIGTPDTREPDLRVTPVIGEQGSNVVEALTPDGEAFLALVA